MWIRSQDKKDLINCKNLGIRKRLNEHVVVSISECGDFYPLGSYSSEEKALKVLDDIQCRIKYKYQDPDYALIHEMPADKDVIV